MKKEARQRLVSEIMKRCLINKENSFKISEYETSWEGTEEIHRLSEEKLKKKSRKIIEKNLKELSEAQELLYASDKYSMLLSGTGAMKISVTWKNT